MKPLSLLCLALITCSPLGDETLVIQADLVSDDAPNTPTGPAIINLGAKVSGPWLTLKLGGPDLDALIPRGERDSITLRLKGPSEVVDVHLQEDDGYLVGAAMVQDGRMDALIYKGPVDTNDPIARGAILR